jgi:hypothetical protein
MRAVIDGPADSALVVLAGPDELAAHYDLTVGHPSVERAQSGVFERWLADAAATYGLSCALVHDGIVGECVRRLSSAELNVGLHLACNTAWHCPGDLFHQLALAVLDAGGQPVNPPARCRAFTDRAAAHYELARHGLGVPPTVVVRPWAGDRALTEQERWHLRLDEPGTRAAIKLAGGSGGGGVVRVDRPTVENIRSALATARNLAPEGTYLVQTEVRPPWLTCSDGQCRPACWRVLSCLGEATAFWWQPGPVGSREVTPEEVRRHRLGPVFAYVQALAELTGLEWFSTELTLCPFPVPGRFVVHDVDGLDLPVVAVDYVRDQGDVEVQSRWPGGMPDGYVRRLAWRFAERAWQVRRHGVPQGDVVRQRVG